jgi:hypothetical protein
MKALTTMRRQRPTQFQNRRCRWTGRLPLARPTAATPMRKIALEEHSRRPISRNVARRQANEKRCHIRRHRTPSAYRRAAAGGDGLAGIDMSVLSVTTPGVQARRMQQRRYARPGANDLLAREVQRRPRRRRRLCGPAAAGSAPPPTSAAGHRSSGSRARLTARPTATISMMKSICRGSRGQELDVPATLSW